MRPKNTNTEHEVEERKKRYGKRMRKSGVLREREKKCEIQTSILAHIENKERGKRDE